MVINEEGNTSTLLTNIGLYSTSVAKMNATRDRITTSMWYDYTHNA